MASYRPPRFPDRQAIQHFILAMKPRAGRIIGALCGMILAGPAWLYGLCVGLLLGHMVDTVRAKPASGTNETASESTKADTDSNPDGTEDKDEDTDAYQQLGLLPGASMADVKKAWRVRSRQAHPDAPGGEAEDFMALKSAYETIMQEKKNDPAEH